MIVAYLDWLDVKMSRVESFNLIKSSAVNQKLSSGLFSVNKDESHVVTRSQATHIIIVILALKVSACFSQFQLRDRPPFTQMETVHSGTFRLPPSNSTTCAVLAVSGPGSNVVRYPPATGELRSSPYAPACLGAGHVSFTQQESPENSSDKFISRVIYKHRIVLRVLGRMM
jgi:hypothetical protein